MNAKPAIADIGLAFARALVAGDYVRAHGMLSESLRNELSADDLKAKYEKMISYTDAPPDTIKLGQIFGPPEKNGIPLGLGWVFVDIDCLNSPKGCWLESVGVLVAQEGARQVIRRIEWGRP